MGQRVRDLLLALRLDWRRRIAAAFQAHHLRRAEEATALLHYHTIRAREWRAETEKLSGDDARGRGPV